MKKVAIVAGGVPPKNIPSADFFIGVDRGALWLLQHRITPDLAIGDFDSVTKAEKRHIHDHATKYIEAPAVKDETDLELAIDEAIALRPKEVRIYGALGRRFDHALTATQLLRKLVSHNIYGEIVDNFNKIIVVRRQITLLRDIEYSYISLIPLGSSAVVTLKGFSYNVSGRAFRAASSLGVSNEISGSSATIRVHEGIVLVIRSKD